MTTGVYVVLIGVYPSCVAKIGSLGLIRFEKGTYGYVGSAQGRGPFSIEGRLGRHFRKHKAPRWHIDYLLRNKSARCVAGVIASSKTRFECVLNRSVQNLALYSIRRFGSSDCREACRSHLTFFGEVKTAEVIPLVTRVFQSLHLRSQVVLGMPSSDCDNSVHAARRLSFTGEAEPNATIP
ncbi:MAG: GIY-YIG nuclease family protein [Thaumarchaeota archaeon]|nr:GIY-YIG nuclease family protein [Nitrososphaerota archaeon]